MTFVIFLLILYFVEIALSLQLSNKSVDFNHSLNPFLVGDTSVAPRPKRYTRWGGDLEVNSEFLVQILDEVELPMETVATTERASKTIIPYEDRPGRIQLGSVQMPKMSTETSTYADPLQYTRFVPLKSKKGPAKDANDLTFPRLLLYVPLKQHQKNDKTHYTQKNLKPNPRLQQHHTMFEHPSFTKAQDRGSVLGVKIEPKEIDEDLEININVKGPSDMEDSAEDVIINAVVPSLGRYKNITAGDESGLSTKCTTKKLKKTSFYPTTNPKSAIEHHTKRTTTYVGKTNKCKKKKPVKIYESLYIDSDENAIDGSDNSDKTEIDIDDKCYLSEETEIDREENGLISDESNTIDSLENKLSDGDGKHQHGGGKPPVGDGKHPHGGGKHQHGGGKHQHGGGKHPHGGGKRPGGGVKQPDGGVKQPDGGVKQPDGGGMQSIFDIKNISEIYDYDNEEIPQRPYLDTHTIDPNSKMSTVNGHHVLSTSNAHATEQNPPSWKPFSFFAHHKLAEITNQLEKWCNNNPLAKCEDVTDGSLTYWKNPILMVIVDDRSHGQDSSAKQTVLVVAGIQGRDFDAVSAAMYLLYELLDRSANHTDLLGGYRFWVVPVFNPDGYEYSASSPNTRDWRKNMKNKIKKPCDGSNSSLCEMNKCIGVNLDRNFEYQWTSDSCRQRPRRSHPCSDLYPGERQLSEPETISLTRYLNRSRVPLYAFVAVKEGDFLGILYPHSHTNKRRVTDALHRKRARQAGQHAHSIAGRHYISGQASEHLPLYAGGIEDWMEGHLGVDNSYAIILTRCNGTNNITIENVCHEVYAAVDTLLLPMAPLVERHMSSAGIDRFSSSAALGTLYLRPSATYKLLDTFTAILQMSLYYFEFRLICTVLYWLRNFESVP